MAAARPHLHRVGRPKVIEMRPVVHRAPVLRCQVVGPGWRWYATAWLLSLAVVALLLWGVLAA
mgnify:FL=1